MTHRTIEIGDLIALKSSPFKTMTVEKVEKSEEKIIISVVCWKDGVLFKEKLDSRTVRPPHTKTFIPLATLTKNIQSNQCTIPNPAIK